MVRMGGMVRMAGLVRMRGMVRMVGIRIEIVGFNMKMRMIGAR